ncbi:MAG: mechanosensitive ion channel family protein [Nitrospirae bacterium]|nr:mechanosensitive ion channel family protein [Nitrospirota bacterium]
MASRSQDAIARLKTKGGQITNLAKDPARLVEILEFNAYGTLLVVRPFSHNHHYWQVCFDTNRAIQEVYKEAAYPTPEQRQAVRDL